MASFTKYVKNKFYNQLFDASDKFVVMHRKELGFYSGWVETYDLDELVPLVWKKDLDEIASSFLKNFYPQALDFPQAINPNWTIIK